VRSRAYTILFERDETGMWCATVPLLPGCVSQGTTKAEAKRKLREAIALHRKASGGSAP
jgi:predicted RNase H-like HicB family nuclease